MIVANKAGTNNLFFRAGKNNQDRDYECNGAIDKGIFTHWVLVSRENGEFAVYKNGEVIQCAFGSVQHDGGAPVV